MARKARGRSQTGIYHVMLRGVNYQQIFEHGNDYRKFILILRDMVSLRDEHKRPLPPRCVLFSYCLMPDHVHLLIKEEGEIIAEVVKKIALRYAIYYNNKYQHCGHLFQNRFKSEPVNDEAYFLTLLRHIHQNPVAGNLCRRVKDYAWSSWCEYISTSHRMIAICSIHQVLALFPLKELIEQVNTPLPKDTQVLEFERYRGAVPDIEVIAFLKSTYHIGTPKDIQHFPKEQRCEILIAAKDFGASIRQLSRLTAISIYSISQVGKKKNRSEALTDNFKTITNEL